MPARQNPEVIVRSFADQMQAAFGTDLESALLVGSAARGDFLPGKSDVNTLLVLTPLGMDQLDKAYPILQPWRKRGLALPHFMTLHSLQRSLDSYPLEILDFRRFHKVITGSDPLQGLEIPAEPLRLQVEREARGKLFLLRQIWAAHAGHDRDLTEAINWALKTFTVIFQGILELKHQPIPAERPQLFVQAATAAGFNAKVFQQVHDLRLGKSGIPVKILFKEVLHEAAGIVAWADEYKISE